VCSYHTSPHHTTGTLLGSVYPCPAPLQCSGRLPSPPMAAGNSIVVLILFISSMKPVWPPFPLHESPLTFLGCTPTMEDMVSELNDDGLVHLPAPSARPAFSPTLDTSISPTFSNFSPSTSSGYSIPSPDSVGTPSDPDDAWNLIPYNVSWGHEYEEYRAGILPGPEGDCIFLRSPTPLRNQRASEACKKCRERKAKVCPDLVSLTHLSCLGSLL
jgi:hypothetical protein